MNRKQKAVLASLGIALAFMSGCRACNSSQSPGGPGQTAGGPGHGEGPGPNQKFGRMSAREFQVYIYTPDPNKPKECSVDWPVGTLWKGASDTDSQTVAWFSDDGSAYKIDFGQGSQSDSNKNPFKDSDGPNYFKVPAGSFRKSGPLRHDASGYYSFAIQNSQGDNCKDPSDPGYYVK